MEDPPFIGDWEQQKRLGSGGFGEVFLWRNRRTEQTVAIKKCIIAPKSLPLDEECKLKSRWKQEIYWMRNCSNDVIVKAIDVQPLQFIQTLNRNNPIELPILVMEYCEGGDLRGELAKIGNINGLKEYQIRNILKCLRNAVAYLHDNFQIAHRDIKPENIVLKKQNGVNVYKLTDLGYAKNIDHHTVQASLVGTKDYFAPEIITDFEYTNNVDYWSMGVIAFELICGTRPFVPHQTLINWMIQIKAKRSNCIAITEDNNGDYIFHEHLFRENHVSSIFQQLIERWLVSALDRDRKVRGYNPPQPNQAPDGVQPKRELIFYTELDIALNSKILTVFNLSAYEFSSYLIHDGMLLPDLVFQIENETKIPAAKLVLILPYNHKVSEITKATNPADLYIENFESDLPMLYVKEYGNCLDDNVPIISPTIKFVLSHKGILKRCVNREFAKHAIFLLREQQQCYLCFLSGLKDYALFIESEMVKFENELQNIGKMILYNTGAVDSYATSVCFGCKFTANNNIPVCADFIEKWQQNYIHFQGTISKLNEVNQRLNVRFKSALRRIRECLNSEYFKDFVKDYFGIKSLEHEIENMTPGNFPLFIESISKSIHACLLTRSKLFGSTDFRNTQKTINEIHEEFQLVQQIFKKTQEELENSKSKLNAAICSYQEQFSQIFCNNESQSNENANNLPNIDIIMGNSLNLDNGGDGNFYSFISNGINSLSFADQSKDTRSVIDESNKILLAAQNQFNDVEMDTAH